MNFPGKESGNWSWPFRWEQLTESVVCLRDTTALSGHGPTERRHANARGYH